MILVLRLLPSSKQIRFSDRESVQMREMTKATTQSCFSA